MVSVKRHGRLIAPLKSYNHSKVKRVQRGHCNADYCPSSVETGRGKAGYPLDFATSQKQTDCCLRLATISEGTIENNI